MYIYRSAANYLISLFYEFHLNSFYSFHHCYLCYHFSSAYLFIYPYYSSHHHYFYFCLLFSIDYIYTIFIYNFVYIFTFYDIVLQLHLPLLTHHHSVHILWYYCFIFDIYFLCPIYIVPILFLYLCLCFHYFLLHVSIHPCLLLFRTSVIYFLICYNPLIWPKLWSQILQLPLVLYITITFYFRL